jgi:hypothetical protein
MHLLQRARGLAIAILILLCLAWAFAEAEQQLLSHRAQQLLSGIRPLEAGRSTWSGVQPLLRTWSDQTTTKGPCTFDACTAQIDLVEALPAIAIGTPGTGAHNWLPRLVDHLGLRGSSAARAGIVVEHGIVTARWFGEQVSLPVRDWHPTDDYVPYLSVSSSETSELAKFTAGQTLLHPNRMVQHKASYIAVTFSPQEDAAEKSALMDFRFDCITRFSPCESHAGILPEALRMLEERQLANPAPPPAAPTR